MIKFPIQTREAGLKTFLFAIRGFHSPNRSEYINDPVVELMEYYALRSLNLPQTNDKNLVASKNDWVAREILGYIQIPQRYAPMINDGHEASLTSYLNNLHWPCSFRGVFVNSKGRERKRYPFYVHSLTARLGHPSLLKRHIDTAVGGIHTHPACRAGVEGGGV